MEPSLELALRAVDYLWLARQEPAQAELVKRAASDGAVRQRLRDLVSVNPPPSTEEAAALFYTRVEGLRELIPEVNPEDGTLTQDRLVEIVEDRLICAPRLMAQVARLLGYMPELVRLAVERAWKRRRRWLKRFRRRRKAFDETRLADFLLRRPPWLRWLCRMGAIPAPFAYVLEDELAEIRKSRKKRKIPEASNLPEPGVAQQAAYDSCLFGVALSGGGIRSATFALGVLQGMADRRLLRLVDYLSTVSGGGYIGSWLVAWIKRWGSVRVVEDAMSGYATPAAWPPENGRPNRDPRSESVRPIRFLREYARYLAPDTGLLSADGWTLASTWLRNTFLNFLILTLFLAAALLAPRFGVWLLAQGAGLRDPFLLGVPKAGWIAAVPLWVACFAIGSNLRSFTAYRTDATDELRGDGEPLVVLSIVSMVVVGAFLEVGYLWICGGMTGGWPIFRQTFAAFLCGTLVLALRSSDHSNAKRGKDWNIWAISRASVMAAAAAALGGGLALLACKFFQHLAEDSLRGTWMALTAGVPLMLSVMSTVVVILIGLLGKDLTDEQREWWSRLGAWILIVAALWLTVGGMSFFTPLWIARFGAAAAGGGIAWASITAAGVKMAYSPQSGRNGEGGGNAVRGILLGMAPAVFVAGFLALVSFGVYFLMAWLYGQLPALLPDAAAHQLCCTGQPFSFARMVDNYWALMYPEALFPIVAAAVAFLLSWVLAWRVDVNEFSMHHFYRNRLVRTFLGASRDRQHRWPSAFTGFDQDDDIPLRRFLTTDPSHADGRDKWTDCEASYAGPYPIVNTALNIMRGADMARQERKAESFAFTPLWTGFDFTRKQTSVPKAALREYAYRPTNRYAKQGGVTMGTAVAISGAAANPNAGFHTSPALAFLLTLFNVRLGAWIGNPRGSRWRWSSPRAVGLGYLLTEMTAQTDIRKKYVQLSDGGHFDNMGLYELVRRRCRYIVVCDAEEDAGFMLEGIGGAIRKCRADFGASIDLDVSSLQPVGEGRFSKAHCAVGSILYPGLGRDGKPQCGKLVYVKSALTGDEPVDVVEFRKRQPQFPNNSTANQFFDESHFESYRALGHHAALKVFVDDAAAALAAEAQSGELACEALGKVFESAKRNWEKAVQAAEKSKA